MNQMIAGVRELGLSHIQLALTPLTILDQDRRQQGIDAIKSSGLILTAGMINFPGENYSTIATIRQTGGYVPDEQWPARREISEKVVPIARELGIRQISTHVGFVPRSSDEKYPVIVQRIGEIATMFGEAGIDLLMESGQERDAELLQFLNDVSSKNLRINFDPANMILYGAGDPFEAIRVLGRHIAHVHVKDAKLSEHPGIEWGKEVPFGAGQVDPARFLESLQAIGYTGPLVIEREGRAPNRLDDIRHAVGVLHKLA